MDMTPYLPIEGEKPLDRIVDDGGFTSIFRTIACVGDSLSSGEFESQNADGVKGFHDRFEYSWGQYIARAAGCKVYNFSQGGMTAVNYMTDFGVKKCFFTPDLAAQAYILAMGVNDVRAVENGKYEDGWGSVEDIADDYRDNKKSFFGYFAAIIQRYQEIQPDAKFFLMTRPRIKDGDPVAQQHADTMYAIAGRLPNCYVLDFNQYGPIYDAAFKDRFYLGGHMNPTGYILTAKMTMSYIDYIIRHNFEDFVQVGFIGTGLANVNAYPIKEKEKK